MIKISTNVDMQGLTSNNVVLERGKVLPTNPKDYQIFFDENDNLLKRYNEKNKDWEVINKGDITTATQIVKTITPAQQTWTYLHNLNGYPEVKCLDENNHEIIGDVEYLDKNAVNVHFKEAVTGTLIIN